MHSLIWNRRTQTFVRSPRKCFASFVTMWPIQAWTDCSMEDPLASRNVCNRKGLEIHQANACWLQTCCRRQELVNIQGRFHCHCANPIPRQHDSPSPASGQGCWCSHGAFCTQGQNHWWATLHLVLHCDVSNDQDPIWHNDYQQTPWQWHKGHTVNLAWHSQTLCWHHNIQDQRSAATQAHNALASAKLVNANWEGSCQSFVANCPQNQLTLFRSAGDPRVLSPDNAKEPTEWRRIQKDSQQGSSTLFILATIVENGICELKRGGGRTMTATDTRACSWDLCLVHTTLVRQNAVSSIWGLEGEVLITRLTGDTWRETPLQLPLRVWIAWLHLVFNFTCNGRDN